MTKRTILSWVLVLGGACGGGDGRNDGSATTLTTVASMSGDTSDDASSGEGETTGGASTGSMTTAVDTTADPATSAPSTTSPGTSGDESSTGSGIVGLETLGSLVVLGDSIGDGGGQAPFYYSLLEADLVAHYGQLEVHNVAESGSETDALIGQANGLPNSLPGPVAVVITSGGNDMKSALQQIVTGTDGPARMQMQANIEAALDELLAPNRFGAGIEVFVFEGNVYDASDGVGDFGAHDCAFGGGLPAIPSDMIFENWNGAIATAVTGKGQDAVDMHGYFYGHGYASSPNWYASDCTHPSSVGHDELHKLFYYHITGEML